MQTGLISAQAPSRTTVDASMLLASIRQIAPQDLIAVESLVPNHII